MLMASAATKHNAREKIPSQSVEEVDAVDLAMGAATLGLLLRRVLKSDDATGKLFMVVEFTRNDMANDETLIVRCVGVHSG